MSNRYNYKALEKGSKSTWVHGAYKKFLPYTPAPLSAKEPKDDEYKYLIITEDFSDWNMPRGLRIFEVEPETVCQSTGLKDTKGVPIYENDIIEVDGLLYVVKWNLGCFFLEGIKPEIFNKKFEEVSGMNIVGNIFDNKDLVDAN